MTTKTEAEAPVRREPHTFMWWAMDRAWANLQRENHSRWERRQELLRSVEPRHYAFIEDCEPLEGAK